MHLPWNPRAIGHAGSLEWWTATLITFYLLVLWDFSGLDLDVMRLIGNAQGFPARHSFWLAQVGHDAMRHAASLALVLLWLAVPWPLGTLRRFERRERLGMALGGSLALLVVNLLKRYSATSCPWDLDLFGGTAHWVSHWDWHDSGDGGPGHCFPGGHASSALAFIALAWPGLATANDPARQRFARRALVLSLAVGVLLGAVQTWRGAHPPSHTAWTAWICWTLSGLLYAALFDAVAEGKGAQAGG